MRATGETGDVALARVYPTGPDHRAPMTWHRCVADGCRVQLDPWLHVTRCPDHQRDMDRQRERARAIVAAAIAAEHRRRS